MGLAKAVGVGALDSGKIPTTVLPRFIVDDGIVM